jgi:predicted SAM-dependent methyltransferase
MDEMMMCRGCGNKEQNRHFVAREMMLGRRTKFDYFECAQCGSLQITEVPPDLSEYYPRGYYSFQKPGKLKSYLKGQWANYSYSGKSFVGRLLASFMDRNPAAVALKRLNPEPTTAILDVGCGGGDLLHDLATLGFNNLKGADPYNENEIDLGCGVIIWKKRLEEIRQNFEVIMLHHTFEHIYEPKTVFSEAHRLLKPGGTLLIRVPVASCFAWRHYRTDWVQLDAPRHLFIPSAKCIHQLASEFGFAVASEYYDSSDFQFWGSEQYKRDISLSDKRSHHRSIQKVIFPTREIRSFRKRAMELNEQKDGDSACFYLRKR